MPNFSYRAYDRNGNAVAGQINAAGEREAVQSLKTSGLFPIEVKRPAAGREGRASGRVPAGALAAFTRQLATLVAAGTSLTEALSVLAENTEIPKLRSTVLDIKESITGGSSLARALEEKKEVFTPFYRGLVLAAEASGSLESVLPRLADYLETRARINVEVRAALTYPALMTLVGASVVFFLFIFVIPKIARIFSDTGAELPLITVLLLSMADLVAAYWHVMIAGGGAAAWFMARQLKRPRGKALLDALLLRLPWFGPIAASFHIASLARTLGSLLKGGVQLLKALEITAEVVDNSVYRNILKAAIKDCSGGAPLSASLKNSGVLPPVVVHMIGVGERSGNLDEMLIRTAEAYDSEFQNGVKKSLALLEPALILIMGMVVGFIVLAMLLPIFELNQVIR
ncbi:MAG: type II secretion system F family protein [Deltaproteobacteria bacterium]|nr:type II secretion system F family protein [Deltaproteobacteria bacterium]MBZ0219137.1 type II secretion system F family protein [Deltaproteobacteria bacterium]